jgi:hypothetical protein
MKSTRKYRFTYDGKNNLTASLGAMTEGLVQIQLFEKSDFTYAYREFMKNPAYMVFFRDDCRYVDDGDPFHEYRYFKYGDVNL